MEQIQGKENTCSRTQRKSCSFPLTSTSPSGSVPRWPTSSYTSQMPKPLSTRAAFPGHGVAPMEGSVVLLNGFFFYLWSELKYLKLIVV